MKKRKAYWTYSRDAHAYYFAPENRQSPPYLRQRQVVAVVDIVHDGALAGIELAFGALPEPPLKKKKEKKK